jgi:hypothetical protein
MAQGKRVTVIIPASSGPVDALQDLADQYRASLKASSREAGARGDEILVTYQFSNASTAERFIKEARMKVRGAKAIRYLENPSREANIVIGGGLGVLLGGVLLGFPGALVGGGIGAVLGSERGDTRRRLSENPRRRRSRR